MNDQIRLLDFSSFTCADMELLVNSYIDGELLAGLRERFFVHLKGCKACQAMLEECKQLVALARKLDDTPIPTAVSRRLREVLREQTGVELEQIRPQLSVVKGGSSV